MAPRALRAGHAQRLDFGMRAAEFLVPTFADHRAVANNHAADHRIGLDVALAAGGQLKRPGHEQARRARSRRFGGRTFGGMAMRQLDMESPWSTIFVDQPGRGKRRLVISPAYSHFARIAIPDRLREAQPRECGAS